MRANSTGAATHRTVRFLSACLLAVALAATGCAGGADGAGSGGDDKAAAGRQEKGGGAAQPEDHAAGPGSGAGSDSGSGSGSGSAAAKKPPKLTGAHIIRTASLTVRVKNVPKALDAARTAAEDAGGIVGNETTDSDGRGHERSRVVLRVPQAQYAEVLNALEGTGKLIERNVKAQDVTEQVVDVESRVKSQRASVARVRELMDRATKLSDVVTLEGELSTRQAELESLLAQQASLKDRTSLATITLVLSETAAPKDEDDEGPGFVDAVVGGWNAFVTVLRWIAVALGAVLPFAAVLAVLALLWRLLRPRFPRRTPALPDGQVTPPVREGGEA
ncbi:DUF4349 domain-containing protein [Streptomyces monticola]|uniref:DUF4349 domain-containing protein n=1 Tax=Streptomyces monticola TaxID=2666263 RepID=A0ABW2JA16_9ACTN